MPETRARQATPATAAGALVAMAIGFQLLSGGPVGAVVDDAKAPNADAVVLRPVLLEPTAVPPVAASDDAAAADALASCDPAAVTALPAVATTPRSGDLARSCVVLADESDPSVRYYLGPAGVTPHMFRSAQATFFTGQGWVVKMDLTKRGSAAWDALAEEQFHQQVAIVLDGTVRSTPQIQPDSQTFESFDGTVVVTGGHDGFTQREARQLALRILAGAKSR